MSHQNVGSVAYTSMFSVIPRFYYLFWQTLICPCSLIIIIKPQVNCNTCRLESQHLHFLTLFAPSHRIRLCLFLLRLTKCKDYSCVLLLCLCYSSCIYRFNVLGSLYTLFKHYYILAYSEKAITILNYFIFYFLNKIIA